jgi:hypothetical protein
MSSSTSSTQHVLAYSSVDNHLTFRKAAQKGDTHKIEELFKSCAISDINSRGPDSGKTALHQAAISGKGPTVVLLLSYGADPTLLDNSGQSPSALASEKGYPKIAASLKKAECAYLERANSVSAKKFKLAANITALEKNSFSELSVEELQKKFSFEYIENMNAINISDWYPQTEYIPLGVTEKGAIPISLEEALSKNKILKKPLDSLVLVQLSDSTGFGVFTLELIPKGTIITQYTGNVYKSAEDFDSSNDDYFVPSFIPFLHWMRNRPELCYISAKKKGNLARFFQHLPKENSIKELFSSYIEKNIDAVRDILKSPALTPKDLESIQLPLAYENLDLIYAFDTASNTPVILLVTTTDIPAKTQLGFSYGNEYWLSKNTSPMYFSPKGRVLSADDLWPVFVQEATIQLQKRQKVASQSSSSHSSSNTLPSSGLGTSMAHFKAEGSKESSRKHISRDASATKPVDSETKKLGHCS